MDTQKEKNARKIEIRFITGPIYLEQIRKVASLSGKSLNVWLLILLLKGFNGPRNIKIRPSLLPVFGISRRAYYRSLASIENIGLISVERKRGQSAVVTLTSAGGSNHG